ncbi:MAG: PAS domain-containing protein [Pseudomonadota bacterium]
MSRFRLKTALVAAALSLLGFAANTCALPVSFGVSFIFGSIFSVIAVSRLGLWTGVVVAAIASSYTYVLWSHPWAIIIFTAEILWMGLALKRGRSNLLLIDGLYWLTLGSLLVVLFYGGIIGVGLQQTTIIVLKQGLNGVFNALAAWILLSFLPVGAWLGSPAHDLRRAYGQIIFQIAAAFVMVPSLGILLILTHREISATQERIIRDISIEAQMTSNALGQWVAMHVNAARFIGELGSSSPLKPSGALQEELRRIHGLYPDFHNVFLANAAATTIAFDPPINEKGQSTIGISFYDRAWFKELSCSLQPTISDVFLGRGGIFAPIFSISVPIVRDGKLSHFGLGAINLERMEKLLQQVSDRGNMLATIVDRNGRIVISTDPSRRPLDALVQKEGLAVPVSSEVELWMPGAKEEINIMQAWKNAFYRARLPIEGTPSWSMLVEYSLAPLQQHFFELAIWGLAVVAAFFVVMTMCAALISRMLTRPILALAQVSKNLPERIAHHEQIVWPQANFVELLELIDNFQHSAAIIDTNLAELNAYSLTLEETVEKRTAELEHERQRLANIIEATHVGTWEWNVQSGETIFNERWAEIVGYRLEELQPITIGSWQELTHPDDLQASEAMLEKHFSGELAYYDCECRMRHKDGHWLWVHDRGQVVSRDPEGKPLLMSGTHEDISEQKKLQARMATIMEEQKIILDNANIGISMVKERKQVWANKKLQDIFGYSQEEIVNASTRIFYPSQESYEALGAVAYPVLATGEAYHCDIVMRRKDGTDIAINISGKAVDPADPQAESIWIFEDISERKDSERRLQEKTLQLESLTRDLEQRVEKEVALRLKGEELLVQQSKLAAMGEMLGAISHQWRQPLNALGIIIQNIREAYAFGELNEEQIENSVEKSMAQIRHMSKTIDDFRNFFRPDKKKASFNVMEVIANVLTMLSSQLSAHQIGYRLTCHTHNRSCEDVAEMIFCEAMTTFGHQNEFQHVILNIVNNAQDAIMAGRVSSPAQQRPAGRITFDFYHGDSSLIIEIGDNGGGIDPGIIDRIFEPYFTTRGPDKGTGLGLYMSKVIMEHMGGKLSVKNSDQGALFILELQGEIVITEG